MSPRGLQISSVCTNFHFFGGLLRWLFIASCKTRHFFNSNYIIYIYTYHRYIYIHRFTFAAKKRAFQTNVCCATLNNWTSMRQTSLKTAPGSWNDKSMHRPGRNFFPKTETSGLWRSFGHEGYAAFVVYIYIWNFCYIVIYSHPPKKLRLHGVPKLKWDEHFFFGSY